MSNAQNRFKTVRYGEVLPSAVGEDDRRARQGGGAVSQSPANAPKLADLSVAELERRLANAKALVAQIEGILAGRRAAVGAATGRVDGRSAGG